MDYIHQREEDTNIRQEKDEITNRGPAPNDEFYKKYSSRGIALIFNHENFESVTRQSRRYGTEKDGEDLKQLLLYLNFEVHLYKDLSCSDITAKINKVAAMDHSDASCILITVMTHGDGEILFARDGYYRERKLWKAFTPLHCPTLAGKPKLFFIQACRGEKVDPGFTLCYVESDSPSTEKMYKIPVMADYLFMYATYDGYLAWREEDKGSPFIQALVNQLKIHHKSKDLLTILTHVSREVAISFSSISNIQYYNQKKEMCSIMSTLIRLFYID